MLGGESRSDIPWILESYDQRTFALNKSVYLQVGGSIESAHHEWANIK